MNKKWISSAFNCEPYSSFEGVSSDHWIFTANIRQSLLRNATQTTKTVHYDWSLLNNRDISDEYMIYTKKKIQFAHSAGAVEYTDCFSVER